MEARRGELVFLIRMRLQGGQNTAAPAWRGSITDAATKQLVYVTTTRDVADFLDARIAEHRAQPAADSEGTV